MKRYSHILLALLLAFSACNVLDEPEMMLEKAPEGERVTVSFNVAVPNDGPATKAMGINPTIDPDGFYIAVFGGSGYFNEWVKATVTAAATNYPSNSTVYNLSASFAVSDSRLRVHFIANCPVALRNSPPISGSRDTEEFVMSQIRSQLDETYNDGYWQKVLLPNGVKAVKNAQDVYVPTNETLAQFPDPIVMVRNFARVYLRNLTPIVGVQGVNAHQLVKIYKFGLAYAPAEGPIAPILSAPYASNVQGEPITVNVDVDENDPSYDSDTPLYYETFFINYQNYNLTSDDPNEVLITGDPFNYAGYSPEDQSFDYYPDNSDPGAPLEADLITWNDVDEQSNVLFVYERSVPTADRRATRLVIQAERINQDDQSDGVKFYALDIVNSEGVSIPILRNQTYTVHLLDIEEGTGESDISKASTATSASVTGNPNYQGLINISDGKSSIGTSFTEKFYVEPQSDYVMFRYIPTNITDENYEANVEGNELVTFSVGLYNANSGVFTELTPAQANAQGVQIFATEGGNYKVSISKNGNDVIQYVRSNNDWVPATAAQIANPEIEKWGMINFELSQSYMDSDGYFTQERTMAIHVIGSYADRELSRNVILKTSPRQIMHVSCVQKYVALSAGEEEDIQILIPTGLSRSVFPLEFTIEADGYSLTPNGDELPVAYGTSTVPGNSTPAFYFVKTLTEDAYKALGTVTRDGQTWKVFTCHFKTTVANNQCSVYVNNRYFTDSDSSDQFFNYTQRLFSWTNQPATVYRKGSTTFTFVMDNDHRNNTTVWWDPQNTLNQSANAEEARTKGLSTSNRVLPPIMTVELIGFTPQYQEDGETPVTAGLFHSSGNKYLYYVGTGAPTSDMATVSLALTATGTVTSGSVTLSTENITENPNLYAVLQSNQVSIQDASFSNVGFSGNYVNAGLNRTIQFHFTYVDGIVEPATLSFDGLAIDGNAGDNALITSNGDGTYTLTPTDLSKRTYTVSVKTTYRYSPCTVYLSADDYSDAEATISRQGNQVTFTTTNTNANFGNSTSKTIDDVTVNFSNRPGGFSIGGTYTTAPNDTRITISAPENSHPSQIVIIYTADNRSANATVVSGDGTYSYSNPRGTWTAGNNPSREVVLNLTRRNNNNARISSIVVTLEDD
ncbi:MAG: hypothetical protein J6X39_02235 [Bacteroidales bacterium]|nr:hypothetical protein [Bacteroidales bacterium]